MVKEVKIIKDKKTSMNSPLEGSLAKVCTEFKIPDLTKKVPVTLKMKVKRQSMIAHSYKIFLFSRTITVCIKAVMANQGSREAFSTGSQNQKPPHPNS